MLVSKSGSSWCINANSSLFYGLLSCSEVGVFRATSQNSSPDLHFRVQRSLYEGSDTASLENTGGGGNRGFGGRKFIELMFARVTPTSFPAPQTKAQGGGRHSQLPAGRNPTATRLLCCLKATELGAWGCCSRLPAVGREGCISRLQVPSVPLLTQSSFLRWVWAINKL